MNLNVLYEDNHLIAVHKPAGILVQGDETGDSTLMDEIKLYLKQKYNKPGNVFLGLLHRLDRPVSGIILFAKTSKGASRLSEQFRSHKVKKIYHTLVEGEVKEKSGTLINFLKKDEQKNFVKVYDREVEGSKRAELDFEVVKSSTKYSLIKIILKTGRSHQIRTQLAHIGHPIVGDVKYGAYNSTENKLHSEICLCATSLEFNGATSNQRRLIKIEIPQEWSVEI
jgi:23S rRNA pseudouridine1911/1915/1917 synthase